MPPSTEQLALVRGVLLFVLTGVLMVVGALLAGALLRRRIDTPVKGQAYECGEETVGQGWVQFDLRFYVVGLIFVIADVVAMLFYLWAVVMRRGGGSAFATILLFFGVLAVGYVYLWRHGYLEWSRAENRKPRGP